MSGSVAHMTARASDRLGAERCTAMEFAVTFFVVEACLALVPLPFFHINFRDELVHDLLGFVIINVGFPLLGHSVNSLILRLYANY